MELAVARGGFVKKGRRGLARREEETYWSAENTCEVKTESQIGGDKL